MADFTEMDSRPFPWAKLMVLVIGAFMAILDGSIVNVALPKLMAIFGVGAESAQWVLTAYLLASGVVVPVTGYLGDRYGYKNLYIFSLVSFTLGSALCGLAWSNSSLVAFRVVQAIGGGMMIPVSMAVIYRIIPREKIGMGLGIWGISAIMAPAIGPTLGGYLIDNFSWHLIFTINIPIGIMAVLLAYIVLEETPKNDNLKFDYLGALLCCAGCFALLLALSEGQDRGWTSYYIISLFTMSGFLLILFCLWELHIPEPMLDIRLLKNKVFTASLLATSFTNVGMFAVIFLIPLYLQNLQGLTPMQTGLLMMPMALAMGFMMPISGKLFDKIGALPLGLVGITGCAYFTFLLHNITLDTSYQELQVLLVIRALFLGLCMMPLSTAGMNTIPPPLIGRASAMNNLARQISASFGVAYLTYTMVGRQAYHAAVLTDAVSLTAPGAVSAQQQIAAMAASSLGPAGGQAAAAGYLSGIVQKQALVQGIGDSILVGTVIVLFTVPVLFLLSKKKMEEQRAIEMAKFFGGKPGAGGPPGMGGPPGVGGPPPSKGGPPPVGAA